MVSMSPRSAALIEPRAADSRSSCLAWTCWCSTNSATSPTVSWGRAALRRDQHRLRTHQPDRHHQPALRELGRSPWLRAADRRYARSAYPPLPRPGVQRPELSPGRRQTQATREVIQRKPPPRPSSEENLRAPDAALRDLSPRSTLDKPPTNPLFFILTHRAPHYSPARRCNIQPAFIVPPGKRACQQETRQRPGGRSLNVTVSLPSATRTQGVGAT